MKERRTTQPLVVRCKLVLVGDVQCGKTAMLQVLAKDCYPEVCYNVSSVSEHELNMDPRTYVLVVLIIRVITFIKMIEFGTHKKRCACCSQFSCAFS